MFGPRQLADNSAARAGHVGEKVEQHQGGVDRKDCHQRQ